MRIAKRILAGCAAIAALVGSSANAATSTWTNTTGGSYDTAGNWSAAPASTDDVVFNLNNTYTVLFPTGADTTNRTALIDGGNVTFDLGGAARTYNLTSPSVLGFVVGRNNTATLTLTNGTFVTANSIIGYEAGSNGTVTVSGPSSRFESNDLLIVGTNYGTGSLSITAGGEVSSAQGNVGHGSSGTMTVDGPGSRLAISGVFSVGTFDGTGSLSITAGGEVSSIHGNVGRDVGGSSGTVTVNGPGSQWMNSGELRVGFGGTGSLSITGGGEVSSIAGYVGRSGGSSGTVTVNGAGSQWMNSGNLYVGGSDSAAGGTGLLHINTGGTVSVGGLLKIWNTGTVNLNGGTLDVGSLSNSGTFNFNAGTLDIDSLTVGSGGLFGPSYSLGGGRNLKVDGATTINLGSTLTINGGNFTTGSLVKNGTFQFLSGTMDLGSTPLTLGAGDTFNLGAGSSFVNTGAISINPGSTFLINGGTFSAGSVTLNGGTFDFTSGQLNLTNSGLTIGAGGLLGNNVTLDASRQVSVSGNAVVQVGATLNVNGGTLGVGNILSISEGGTVNGQGTFNGSTLLVNGTLNLTGNADINNETVLIGDFFLPGGPAQISVADGTTTRFYGDVFANGTGITVGAGGEAIYYGYLGGGGTLGGAGTHTAGGTVSPGNSPGLLTVEGDFVFENTATFLVEINGLTRGTDPGYDAMDIGGDAWLAGILDVDLLDGFAPNAGDTFDILSALVLHGTFDSTVFPALGNDLRWELQYLLNETGMDTVRLSAQVVPVPAAVWLFGSGLGVLMLLRRRSAPAPVTLH